MLYIYVFHGKIVKDTVKGDSMTLNDISKYKHIIWDFNGTLLNDADHVISVMNTMLSRRSLPGIDRNSYSELFDFPVIDYYLKLGFDFKLEDYNDVATEFVDEYFKKGFVCSLQDGLPHILDKIQDKGISQSILSASNRSHLVDYLSVLGIRDYFMLIGALDDILGGSKATAGKMHLSQLGIDPGHILYIGDTTHDFMVADELGCDHLLVANGHHSKKRLIKVTSRIIDSLTSIAGCL